ncbi:MAG: methionyl-tRNA formyltransferase [Candidatus Woykebacteria bacterium]
MILKLYRHRGKIWKQKFQSIKAISPQLKQLVKDMQETLELTSGVGLAAPQIGQPLRLFIVDYGELKETFINPKIIKREKEADEVEEGCLSVPGVRGLVSRSTGIEIDYIDIHGKKKRAILAGYYARIVQHEYDHLSSTFYTSHIVDKNKLYTYKPIKIVYFGTSEFAVPILKTLYGQQFVGEVEIPLVITAPDAPAGRGKTSTSSLVKLIATEFNLNIDTPASLKGNKKFVSKLKSLNPDFIVLASYGKIIPKEILEVPKKGSINVHPSILPKYRGPSPIGSAILAGDKSTGVTIIKMNEKMDEGDILGTARIRISTKDTAQSLSKKLADLSSKFILHILHLAHLEKIKAKPQNHKLATYTKIIRKEDGLINWKKPPQNLELIIRAYYPWPGVWTKYNGKILKLLPGNKLQLEGKNPVTVKEFKAGHKDFTLNW